MHYTYTGNMKVLPRGESYSEAQFIFQGASAPVLSCASNDVVLIRNTNPTSGYYSITAFTPYYPTYMCGVEGSYSRYVSTGWDNIKENGTIIMYQYSFFIGIPTNNWIDFPPYRNAGQDYSSVLQAHDILEFLAKKPAISISYIPIGCTLSGPDEGESGSEVSVLVTPNTGNIIRNPEQGADISVYNKDGYIPFTYNNGSLNFTVP